MTQGEAESTREDDVDPPSGLSEKTLTTWTAASVPAQGIEVMTDVMTGVMTGVLMRVVVEGVCVDTPLLPKVPMGQEVGVRRCAHLPAPPSWCRMSSVEWCLRRST